METHPYLASKRVRTYATLAARNHGPMQDQERTLTHHIATSRVSIRNPSRDTSSHRPWSTLIGTQPIHTRVTKHPSIPSNIIIVITSVLLAVVDTDVQSIPEYPKPDNKKWPMHRTSRGGQNSWRVLFRHSSNKNPYFLSVSLNDST